MSGHRKRATLAVGAAMALLLTSCDRSSPADAGNASTGSVDQTVSPDSDTGGGSASPGGWSLTTRHDEMTDGDVLQLRTWLTGDRADVQVDVTCNATSDTIGYDLAGFDKQRRGAGMMTKFGDDGPYHPFTYRIDASEIHPGSSNTRYQNRISLPMPGGLVDARRLVVSIPFVNSDETYVIDQDDPTFRKAIGRCHQDRLTIEEAQQDQDDANVAAEQAEDAAPVMVEPATPRASGELQPPGDGSPTWNSVTDQ